MDLTHGAIAINISQREAVLSTRAEAERILAITPLFHVYAMAMCLHLAAYARSTLVVLPLYRPELALEAMARHRITLLAGSPTIFQGLMAHPRLCGYRLLVAGAVQLRRLGASRRRRWRAGSRRPAAPSAKATA